ncbi:type VI secretion system-associated protein TagO [Azoarcus indigens]|uniref:Type VI secretion system protein VasI n=1 Tax=Azoarcus indigens TaxID=29545 RepID=A0A4R6DQH8_9RHOO|nr:type VI secretion system-associated protein VasI [Azoarcus indigens]NMG67093.1 type VI secretion system-associated protein TagO [Azoarcus indigens]TDN47260.1 type VI secretion system protein VasI [Azoarcus indigens]
MKTYPSLLFYPLVCLLLAPLAGCGSGESAVAAAPGDCVRIVSAMERLACFDAGAGTPPSRPGAEDANAEVAGVSAPVRQEPEIIALVRRLEMARSPGEEGFRLLQEADSTPAQARVVLSAPALEAPPGQPRMVISCLSNISRLQLLADRPFARNRMEIRLSLDGRPLGGVRPWQVLEDGRLVDAGRGLVAIEQLRQLAQPGEVLRIESDAALVDGLRFDASRLQGLIAVQREACHW